MSSKRQVTIPETVLIGVGLTTGDVLCVEAIDGSIVLRPEEAVATRRMRALAELSGSLTGVYEPGYLKKLRDEWR